MFEFEDVSPGSILTTILGDDDTPTPGASMFSDAYALATATAQQTALAEAKVRLFKADGFSPARNTTRAQFIAHEALFSGYPTGGIEITDWLAPYLAVGGGAAINSGVIQFIVASASPLVTDVVAGWWCETAAGVVIDYDTLPSPWPMAAVGDALPFNIRLLWCKPVS